MHFKYPEVFYFLALLIIPILVHLFQLKRFVKIPFTNVAFLQKLALQTRKSSQIKKWLILVTRSLLLLAILFSFSQPYLSSNELHKEQNTLIYLDNSLSTNSEGEKGNLLLNSAQEIIDNISSNNTYSLLTNDVFLENIDGNELRNELLKTKNSSKKVSFDEVLLKIKDKFKNKTNTLNKNILISDFQNHYNKKFTNVTPLISLINLKQTTKTNVSIDSVFIEKDNLNNYLVNVVVNNQGSLKNDTPIALYNDSKLIGKQSFRIESDSKKTIQFPIKNASNFLGKIEITFSDTFKFDNIFYFTINQSKKTSILSIGKNNDFLARIFTKDNFEFKNSTIQNINYNAIPKQQLIVLNEIDKIPFSLSESLIDYSNKGGNIAIIPSNNLDISSYNSFLRKLNAGRIDRKKNDSLKITNINYSHPLLTNVFSKQVKNFQYPIVYNHFSTRFNNSSTIVSLENNEGFIKQVDLQNAKLYWVSGSLEINNSNFINSPLVVPIFYNFGQKSLNKTKLFYRLDESNKIDVNIQLKKDEILSIKDQNNSFIPLQQTYQNKVSLTTTELPENAGFYQITLQDKTVKTIAFNNPKEESSLDFLDIEKLSNTNKNLIISTSIDDIFKEINKKNEVRWLWKWFLALAIVSLLLEILILKFLKP